MKKYTMSYLKKNIGKFVLSLLISVSSICLSNKSCEATRLSKELKVAIKSQMPEVQVRLDGVLQTKDKELFVPIIPKGNEKSSGPVKIIAKFPKTNPRVIAFDNNWIFVKLVKVEDKLMFSLPDGIESNIKQKVLNGSMPSDLIVPSGMTTTEEYKAVKGELDIDIIATASGSSHTTNQEKETPVETETSPEVNPEETEQISQNGTIFLTSPQTGKIIILDKHCDKKSELQTDGTPAGMTFSNHKIYICDQSKNRILVVDPETDKFDTQINLEPGSSPKGLVSLKKGKFLYVCETARSFVSVIELSTGKILLRTKVRPGPTKIAITPSGYLLLVLNGQSGEVTFISTLNQKSLGFVKVGELPSDIIVSNNSKAAFISNRVSNTISIIDIAHRKVANTIKVGDGPTGLALSPDEKMLYVANAKDNTIAAYNTQNYKKEKDIQLPLDVEFPGKIMFIPGTNNLLITSAATDTVGLLDTDTMEFSKQVQVGCTTDNAIWVTK